MAKSRIGAIDEQFRERVLPTFISWGLARHPNKGTYFGRDQSGYCYELADTRDINNIKLCSCSIYRRDSSISIQVDKGIRVIGTSKEIPTLYDDPNKKVLTLSRPLTIKRLFASFMDASFRLDQRKNETVEVAASRLIDDIQKELPKAKNYLYG